MYLGLYASTGSKTRPPNLCYATCRSMQYYAWSVGAILQILYNISTIGYIYRRTYERMRERDKNDIHVSFTNYLCQFMIDDLFIYDDDL